MYKELALITLTGVTLAGCHMTEGGEDWTKDCETYYSENTRALNDCKARREMGLKATAPAGGNAAGVSLESEKLDTTTQRNDDGKEPDTSGDHNDGRP